jgi:hypothetical protein
MRWRKRAPSASIGSLKSAQRGGRSALPAARKVRLSVSQPAVGDCAAMIWSAFMPSK